MSKSEISGFGKQNFTLLKIFKFSNDVFVLVYEFSSGIEEAYMIKWEKFVSDELKIKKEKDSKEGVEFKIEQNAERLDILSSKLEEALEDDNNEINESINSLTVKIEKLFEMLEDRSKTQI